ncbi:photosystem II stability/assembly factor-like protein [Algoriphagus lacus]|uniref:Photosystem II stability/assembly factor-like protein n=1 Tax=Algoriphagus lacus TaxID=2056311 RepID=A0A418PWW3_9BACT|nr:YCF48-related protein [Algoriphagus lacus]RIW18556.1 photosystem II stability/assembly factor-like protein [Algoriphagus lacus]
MRLIALLFLGLFWAGIGHAQNWQWKELNTPVKASLRGLSPVSGRVCWASGSGGTWLKTTDGGETWEYGVIAGLDTVDFRSIQAFDEQTAVAASAGQPAVIYLTNDGGKSWEKVHQEGPEAFFDAISFVNKKKGFVLGDPVGGKWMILETKNGGKTWNTLTSLPLATPGEAAFAASSSSMTTNSDGIAFATGGSVSRLHFFSLEKRVWTVSDLAQIAQGAPAKGVFAMTLAEDRRILVGGDYTLLESREGNALVVGDISTKTPDVAPFGYRSGVAFWKKEQLVISVGPSGSDFSVDLGNTWKNFSDIGYHSVKSSHDGKRVWASGSQGRIGFLLD